MTRPPILASDCVNRSTLFGLKNGQLGRPDAADVPVVDRLPLVVLRGGGRALDKRSKDTNDRTG